MSVLSSWLRRGELRSVDNPGQAPQRSGWNRLPCELRLAIYPLTWESRRVTLRRHWQPQSDDKGVVVWAVTGPCIPSTMHLNYEARQATLRHYIPMGGPMSQTGRHLTTYFNPSLDILYIADEIPQLDDSTVKHPTESLQRFLDVVALPEHILVQDSSQLFRLESSLRASHEVVARFPAFLSVDIAPVEYKPTVAYFLIRRRIQCLQRSGLHTTNPRSIP